MKLKRAGEAGEIDAEVISRDGNAVRVRIGERQLEAEFVAGPEGGGGTLSIEGRRYPVFVARRGDSILVSAGPASFEFKPADAASPSRGRGLLTPAIIAPMPGKVLSIAVGEGDLVEAGQVLVVIEAMKMETTLAAESAAMVKRVCVAEGQMVDHGAVLIELSPSPASQARESIRRDE